MGVLEDPALAEELAARAEADQVARREATRRAGPDGTTATKMCVAKSARLIRETPQGSRMCSNAAAGRVDGWSETTAPKPRGCCVTTQTVTRRTGVVRSRCLRLRWLPVTFAARQLAYLTGRVLLAEGRPQRYGTHSTPSPVSWSRVPSRRPTRSTSAARPWTCAHSRSTSTAFDVSSAEPLDQIRRVATWAAATAVEDGVVVPHAFDAARSDDTYRVPRASRSGAGRNAKASGSSLLVARRYSRM